MKKVKLFKCVALVFSLVAVDASFVADGGWAGNCWDLKFN